MNNPAHVEFRNLVSKLCDKTPKTYHEAVTRSEDFVPICRATADDVGGSLQFCTFWQSLGNQYGPTIT